MNLPLEQEVIRAKCFHPSGTFVEFPIEDVEASIPARFEKIARQYPDRIAVKFGGIKAVGLKRWAEQRGLAMGIGTMAGSCTNSVAVVTL